MSIVMRVFPVFSVLLLAGSSGFAQSAPVPAADASSANGAAISAIVQPALQDVQRVSGSLNTGKWRTSNDVKSSTDKNLASIQRDLTETLPNLLSRADNAAGAVEPVFAVYRNVDALYDVLLRVTQTAIMAAPPSEASAVESALERLESARKQLGDVINTSVADRESQIVKLQAAVKAAAAPPPAATKPAVVDDGPPAKPAPAVKKKKKPAAKPAAKPATADPNAAPPSTN
jgi:hypothetical protein